MVCVMENECCGAQGESQNSFGSFSLQRTSLYAVEGTSGSGICVQSRKSTLEAKELGNLKKKIDGMMATLGITQATSKRVQ